MTQIEDLSDDDLVRHAGVDEDFRSYMLDREMTRRLKVAIEANTEAARKSSRAVILLNVLIVVLTLVLVGIAIF